MGFSDSFEVFFWYYLGIRDSVIFPKYYLGIPNFCSIQKYYLGIPNFSSTQKYYLGIYYLGLAREARPEKKFDYLRKYYLGISIWDSEIVFSEIVGFLDSIFRDSEIPR